MSKETQCNGTLNEINLFSLPIEKVTDDRITNSSSSSISTYIKMLSNNNNPFPEKPRKNSKSTNLLKSIQLSFSRNKANYPPDSYNNIKTTPELVNNPYISKAILNKMNEIIKENSSEGIELKKKLFQKTIDHLNEKARVDSESKKNEIIRLLTRNRKNDKTGDNERGMRSTFSVNNLITINKSSNDINQKRSPSVVKVAQMKQMLDKVFDVCSEGNNHIVSKVNSFGGGNKANNGIKSRILTYKSSKDVLRRKRQEGENDVDLFKMQLDKRKESGLTNHNGLPNKMKYLRSYNREEI